jgi:hypothetical protein
MIAALAVTELVVAVAHGWSTALADGEARARFPKPSDLEHAARHEWPVLRQLAGDRDAHPLPRSG